MPDREKVLKALKHCISEITCRRCPYEKIECTITLKKDVLALLKEQEPVAVHDPGAYCPKCGWMLYPNDHPHHCGNCGQAVKWE